MPEVNPFQSPQSDAELITAGFMGEADSGGLWRDGNQLVIRKRTVLPSICVKSNQPGTRRLRRNLAWHSPALYLLIFIGILIYVIVAVIVTKKATIDIALTPEWWARRRKAMLVAWCLVLAGIAGVFSPIMLDLNSDASTLVAVLAAIVVFIIGCLWGTIGARMVVATKITNTHAWIKGVHPDFLARFPVWDGRGW
jgi:hypothetical protein